MNQEVSQDRDPQWWAIGALALIVVGLALSFALKPVLAAVVASWPATPRPVQTPAVRSAGSTAALTISRCLPT